MTAREYLTASLSKFQFTESEISLILYNQEIEEGAALSPEELKLVLYKEFSNILPVMEISEGGFSMKTNLEALKIWYSLLAKELGKEDVLKSVSGKDVEVNDVSYLF